MKPPSATWKESVGLDRRLDIMGRSLSCDLRSGADWEVGTKDRARSGGINGEGMAAMERGGEVFTPQSLQEGVGKPRFLTMCSSENDC